MKYSPSTDYISFLPRLREGDRVTYGGTDWEIRDFSTYDHANGYEMVTNQPKKRELDKKRIAAK